MDSIRGIERTAFVTTIAELRAMPVTLGMVGNLVYVQGEGALGDGGGGLYLCTQTNPGTDNGTSRVASATSSFYFERMVRNAVSRFFVVNSGAQTNATGDNTAPIVTFGTVIYDHNGDFASSTFTAPVAGVYSFLTGVKFTGIGAAHTTGLIQFASTPRSVRCTFNPANLRDVNNQASVYMGADIELAAGNTVQVQVEIDNGTKTVSIGVGGAAIHETYFAGHLAP